MFGLGGEQSTKRGVFESELGNSMEAGLIVQDNKPSAGLNTGTQQSIIMIE